MLPGSLTGNNSHGRPFTLDKSLHLLLCRVLLHLTAFSSHVCGCYVGIWLGFDLWSLVLESCFRACCLLTFSVVLWIVSAVALWLNRPQTTRCSPFGRHSFHWLPQVVWQRFVARCPSWHRYQRTFWSLLFLHHWVFPWGPPAWTQPELRGTSGLGSALQVSLQPFIDSLAWSVLAVFNGLTGRSWLQFEASSVLLTNCCHR